MPTIPCPEPLLIGPAPAEGEEDKRFKFGLPDLLFWLVASDYRFNTNGRGIRASVRVDAAARAANGAVELDEEALALVNECLEKPRGTVRDEEGKTQIVDLNYPIEPARVLGPMLAAVHAAAKN